MDVLLPRRNGLDSVEMLRRRGIKTPVIVLTALSAVERRIEGLERGADDYMVKPFSFAELMARIEAICRRTQERSPPVLEAGELRLDLATRRLTRAGTEIALSPTEHRLMELLMRHAGHLVTRKMLCEHV